MQSKFLRTDFFAEERRVLQYSTTYIRKRSDDRKAFIIGYF